MSDKDDEIIKEAKERFAYADEMEAENNRLWEEDLRFANGDSDNGYQWNEADLNARKNAQDPRPAVTINKVKQHNLQIVNDAKKGRSSPKVIAVDNDADEEAAEVFNGIIKHIESQSCAQSAYSTAMEYQVDAGLGYWLISTDYEEDSVDKQIITIERVKNPLNIRLDPDIQKVDGSDAKYGFMYEDILRTEYKAKYGDTLRPWTQDSKITAWSNDKMVRLCEYYRVKEIEDTLVLMPDESVAYASELKAIPKGAKTRKSCKRTVEWFLLTDEKILDSKVWAGKYIPIVRCAGLETVIDGKTVRKSHTRAMKDPQRIYNMWSSSAVEFVKLQGKQPYLAAQEAIEGKEKFWKNANNQNFPYLPYNQFDAEGNKIDMPQRQLPPIMAQAYIDGMRISSEDMQSVSGQYDGQFGKNVNEQSGVALRTVERQGENATFHFIDNCDIAKRFTAVILVDLIPKIYDTKRIAMITGEDGKQKQVTLDPSLDTASAKTRNRRGELESVFNINVGRYDVVATVGTSYETKRQESAEAMLAMTQANPAVWQTHGDLIAKAQDWPMADEFAKRFEKIMPPGLVDDENSEEQNQVPPEIQNQLKQLDETVQQMSAELESKQRMEQIEDQKLEIERVKAEAELAKKREEARAMELQNRAQEIIAYQQEHEVITPEIEALNQQMAVMMQGLNDMQQALLQIAQMSAIAASPRRTELEMDADGMPVGSVSYPMPQQGQMQ